MGSNATSKITDQWGLREIIVRGDRLLDFCAGNDMIINNIVFKQSKRRLYSWTSLGCNSKIQIDLMLCSGR